MTPSRAYVASDVPLQDQREVVVTNASLGPSKFSIRLKNSNWEYQRMRSELESTALRSLTIYPDKGTPCIAIKSEKLHRGLVLSTNRDQRTSNVCLVDSGCIVGVPHNMLFQIPDEIMAYRLFSTSVALFDGEALSQKPGLNEIFSSLVLSLNHLTCEVVPIESTLQTVVNLYNGERQNIAEVVLKIYNNLVPKLKDLSPASPPIPKIGIPDPKLQSTEKLFVLVSHRVGHFYGQLLNRPISELTDMFSELRNYYEANPQTLRLDAGSCTGQIAVVKWSLDGKYYRSRILNVTDNSVEIQFIDFGDLITVPRRDIFAPVASSCFTQPAFGINCVLSRDGAAVLKKEHWDAALLEKSVEVRIVNKNPDGTYTVALTIDPSNHPVLEILYPQSKPVVMTQPAAQLELKKPPIQHPSSVSKDAELEPKKPPTQSLSTILKCVPTETRSINKPREGSTAKKLPSRQIYVPPNRRANVPVNEPFVQRPVASPLVKEMVRTPRGPSSAASGSQRGFLQAESAADKIKDAVKRMDRADSSLPSIPVPIRTYAFLDTPHQNVKIAWFYNFELFFLTPMDVTTYEAELEPLNGFYASLSPNELVEDSPKVGLPCVVRFKNDNRFYRSQIVAIFPDKTAQILFVDYGNEQLTPLTDIKRIVPKFMELPQLVWPCKLAGIDGSQLRTDITLSADDELIATFLFVDKGVHLVKVLHKTHGDMATYVTTNSVPVLYPAVSHLRDPKHQLRSDGYDVYISHVKSASEFWIQLKEDEQIINDIGDELTQHVEKEATMVERPVVGQLYAMELPEFGGYYRARVSSLNGNKVLASFVDYGDAHPVSIEKVFLLPDRLGALPPLATRCSMSRQKWPLEAEKRFVTMTFDPAVVFRAVLRQSAPGEGIRVVDSLALDGKNIELEIFAGLDAALKKEQHKVVAASPQPQVKANLVSKSIEDDIFPEVDKKKSKLGAREVKKLDLCDPDGYDVYISYVDSPSDFWIQFKAEENVINKVLDDLPGKLKKTNLPVVVDQLYAVEHPTIGGKFRARIISVDGKSAKAFFVDYGDVQPVPIESIFLMPEPLRLLPPLATRCRMKRQEWLPEEKEKFSAITSNLDNVFRATFGTTDENGVRRVVALFFDGKNIEGDIFPTLQNKKNVKPVKTESKQPTSPPVTVLPVILGAVEHVKSDPASGLEGVKHEGREASRSLQADPGLLFSDLEGAEPQVDIGTTRSLQDTLPLGKEESVDEEIAMDSILIRNLDVLDDARQSLESVKSSFVIDVISATLKPVSQDHILIPIVQMLEATIEEDQVVSFFVCDVPSELESNNPDSILTGIRIGSVIEEQQTVSIVISDEPSTHINLNPVSPVEEEKQTVSILMEWEEENASDPTGKTATSGPELHCTARDEEQPAAPVLLDMPSDPSATLVPIVHEEEGTCSLLKENKDSDPVLMIYEEDANNKLPTRAQLVPKVVSGANGELNDPAQTLLLPHTDPAHSPNSEEEEEQAFGLEPINDQSSDPSSSPIYMIAKEEQTIESQFGVDTKIMDQSFNSSFPTPDRSVLDDSSNLELFNMSIICSSDKKTEEVHELLASNGSPINQLVNGRMDSHSELKVDGVDCTKRDKTPAHIAKDSIIMSSGRVVDEPLSFIPAVFAVAEPSREPLG